MVHSFTNYSYTIVFSMLLLLLGYTDYWDHYRICYSYYYWYHYCYYTAYHINMEEKRKR